MERKITQPFRLADPVEKNRLMGKDLNGIQIYPLLRVFYNPFTKQVDLHYTLMIRHLIVSNRPIDNPAIA